VVVGVGGVGGAPGAVGGGGGFETPKLPVGTPLLGAVGLHNVRWYRYTAIGVSQQRDHKHTQPPTP